MPLPRFLPRQIHTEHHIAWWPDWVTDAECRKYDPDIFFDIGVSGRNPEKVRRAKKICAECTVRELCLRDNIGVPYGVFGGMTPGERLQMLKRMSQRRRWRGESSISDQFFMKYAEALRTNPMTGSRSSSELMRRLAHESGVFTNG